MEIGLHDVIFEGDSPIVIQALKNGSADPAVYGNLIEDTLAHAQLNFFDFFHVKRSSNNVVDALAKKLKQGRSFRFG